MDFWASMKYCSYFAQLTILTMNETLTARTKRALSAIQANLSRVSEFASHFLFPKELTLLGVSVPFYEARPAGLTRYGVGQNSVLCGCHLLYRHLTSM